MIIHTLKILIEYEDADGTSSLFLLPFNLHAMNSLDEQRISHIGITNYLSNTVVDSIYQHTRTKAPFSITKYTCTCMQVHIKFVPSDHSALDSLQALVEPRTRLFSLMAWLAEKNQAPKLGSGHLAAQCGWS